jgi:hypothetical protein
LTEVSQWTKGSISIRRKFALASNTNIPINVDYNKNKNNKNINKKKKIIRTEKENGNSRRPHKVQDHNLEKYYLVDEISFSCIPSESESGQRGVVKFNQDD